MTTGLVTVVVPVYKTERYLDKCVGSIVSQTYTNLEIILIDDGSPDNCPQMCDAWAQKDQRIHVVHKENAGQGVARNVGMTISNGEYICFIDSDDYIAPDTIECAYALAQKECADTVVFGITDVSPEEELILQRIPKTKKNVYCGGEVETEFLPDLIGPDPKTGASSNLWMSACTCLISMKVINETNWRFVSEREIISEDVYSLLGLYAHIDKVAVLKAAPYFCHENPISFSRAYRPDRFEKAKQFYTKVIQRCRELGFSRDIQRRCAEPFIAYVIAALKQEVAHHRRWLDVMDHLQSMIDDELLQSVLEEIRTDCMSKNRKILFWAMRHKYYCVCYLLLTVKNKSVGK